MRGWVNYSRSSAICPELRLINDGVAEYADSYATKPHKWLVTNFDCGVLWLAGSVRCT